MTRSEMLEMNMILRDLDLVRAYICDSRFGCENREKSRREGGVRGGEEKGGGVRVYTFNTVWKVPSRRGSGRHWRNASLDLGLSANRK